MGPARARWWRIVSGRGAVALGCAAAAALLAGVGCGSAGGPATASARPQLSACSRGAGGSRAYVIASDGAGATRTACVRFQGPTIPAQQLLSESGLSVTTATLSFGVAVCSVAGVPAQAPGCIPPGAPYWSVWYSSERSWVYSTVTVDKLTIRSGESLGLHYIPQSGTPAPPGAPPEPG
jgi:hypothetical protein